MPKHALAAGPELQRLWDKGPPSPRGSPEGDKDYQV